MNSRLKLVPSKSLAKDELIHKPPLRRNTQHIHLDTDRLFGKEITNYSLLAKENINDNLPHNKKALSKSICPKPRGQSTQKESSCVPCVTSAFPLESAILRVPENVLEYYQEICSYLLKTQLQSPRISPCHLLNQKEVTPKLRQNLVTELVQLHHKFKLLPSTLFKTVNLMDIYLNANTDLSKRRLELLGLACLFLAGKYEEIYPPSLHRIIDASGRTHSSCQIIDMEGKVLKQMNFNITATTSSTHFECLALECGLSDLQKMKGLYLCELVLYKAEGVKFKPLEVAISSACMVKCSMRASILQRSSGVMEKVVLECEEMMRGCFEEARTSENASKSKFSLEKYLGVSKMDIL